MRTRDKFRARRRDGRGARGARGGVTLFEAVAAMTIVALVSIAALEAVGSQMRVAERARRAVETAALAQQRLDWLDFLNEQQLRSLPDTVREGKFEAPLTEYAWTTTAMPVSTQPGVFDVVVKVTWPGDAFELRSLVYRRPVIVAAGAR
jgi:type II secretory pathway pseudopilin PulG